MTEYFQVMNETNPIVLKGLEVLGISTMNPLHVER